MNQNQMMINPLTPATSPETKCYINGCPNQGNGICRWKINGGCCASTANGGCGKRFCPQHSFIPNARLISG